MVVADSFVLDALDADVVVDPSLAPEAVLPVGAGVAVAEAVPLAVVVPLVAAKGVASSPQRSAAVVTLSP